MALQQTEEFKRDAVRIALSSKDQELIQWINFPEERPDTSASILRFGDWHVDPEQMDQYLS